MCCCISALRVIIIIYETEICALLGYYAALNGSSVPTFRANLSFPSSRDGKMGPIDCPETSVQNYHLTLRNIPEERRSHVHRGRSLKSRNLRTQIQTQFSSGINDHAIRTSFKNSKHVQKFTLFLVYFKRQRFISCIASVKSLACIVKTTSTWWTIFFESW
jgi:hypothetical protein